MRKYSKAEVGTLDPRFVGETTHVSFRQGIKELQKRCFNLLEVLEAEASTGPSTSKRLEEAITNANE